jgi:hypothetical protein
MNSDSVIHDGRGGYMIFVKIHSAVSRTIAVALLLLGTASAAEPDANTFAHKVYAVTKAGNYQAYEQLMHPRCHAIATTQKSFELRSDLLNKLAPGAKIEAMLIADYQAMMQKRGAPPNSSNYSVQPSHIVIVRGTLPGVEGGDHIALNPIVNSDGTWTLLDGDCLSATPSAPRPRP